MGLLGLCFRAAHGKVPAEYSCPYRLSRKTDAPGGDRGLSAAVAGNAIAAGREFSFSTSAS